MRAAKQIVDWVRSTSIMEELGFPSKVSVELDNSREFTLISGYGAHNKCRARPKGADQCRGGRCATLPSEKRRRGRRLTPVHRRPQIRMR